MAGSSGTILSASQVARLEKRRKELRLTRAKFVEKFDSAAKAAGCITTVWALRMRLDRVFNPKMRRPLSEPTKVALAQALDWTDAEFEKELGLGSQSRANDIKAGDPSTEGKLSARQIAHVVAVQLETHQISRGVDLKKDNLTKVYRAAYRMFQRIRDLMGELSADEFARGSQTKAIYENLKQILNGTLRTHLTEWPERYEEWRVRFARTKTGRKLSEREMQNRFPERAQLVRNLNQVAKKLKADARKLRKLISAKRR